MQRTISQLLTRLERAICEVKKELEQISEEKRDREGQLYRMENTVEKLKSMQWAAQDAEVIERLHGIEVPVDPEAPE